MKEKPSPINVYLDEISLTATCSASLSLADLELFLQEKGYTLGYRSESKSGTIREILNQKVPNLWSSYYGELDDLCMALSVNTPSGPIQTRRAPRAATGPDFKKIFIGSSGKYGTIQEAVFRVSRRPEREIAFRIKWKNGGADDFLKKFLGSGIGFRLLQKIHPREFKLELCGLGEIVETGMKTVQKMVKETGGICSRRRGR